MPSLTALNVLPTVQAAHCRSAVALPALERPCPTAQVCQVAQVSTEVVLVLAPALNCPPTQSAHTRSLEAVAAAVVRLPAVQASLTVAQAAPSSVSE